MARIHKASITLCALLFTTLTFTPLATASEQTRGAAVNKSHVVKASERKKNSQTNKTSKKSSGTASKATAKAENKKVTTAKKTSTVSKKTASSKTSKNTPRHSKSSKVPAPVVAMTEKCTKRKGHKSQCVKVKGNKPVTISEAHKVRMQKIQKTAMSKLMNQIGKPYHWGGTSPMTGFDCSGLVYYAYKDLVKFRIPRTANEMYHLRDASPVNVAELESGDLVFFRTQGRGTADHVGVYVGNGKFIQSPRSGQDIQITSLSEDYWQRHYVGARRVVTPKTIR